MNYMSSEEMPPCEIGQFNQQLQQHLTTYFSGFKENLFRFDEPDPKSLPSEPTFYIFMSQIYEDTSVRANFTSSWNKDTESFDVVDGLIECQYVVIYWDGASGGGDSPMAAPDNQTVACLTAMVRGLLSLRLEPAFSAYRLKLIEPEGSRMVANYWQAFGNRPRTIITFSVTLPLKELATAPQAFAVRDVALGMLQGQGDWQTAVSNTLQAELSAALKSQLHPSALTHIQIVVTPVAAVGEGEADIRHVRLAVSGLAFADDAGLLTPFVKKWQGRELCEDDVSVVVDEVESNITAVTFPAAGARPGSTPLH